MTSKAPSQPRPARRWFVKLHRWLGIGAAIFWLIQAVTGIFMSLLSRKNEYAADAFACRFNLGDALIKGLKTISSNALSNLTPHPLYVFFHYSHPPLLQRIKAIEILKRDV